MNEFDHLSALTKGMGRYAAALTQTPNVSSMPLVRGKGLTHSGMSDKYTSFSELAQWETEGRDFRVRCRLHLGTTAVIAPHGGGIEPGTSELADAISGDDLSFYAFEGKKPTGNHLLHVTSTAFDEPRCIDLVRSSPRAVAIHGENTGQQVVFLGGRDVEMVNRLRTALTSSGFTVKQHKTLQGSHALNICNRCETGRGIQLELSRGLRMSFFRSLGADDRKIKTDRFHRFVSAMRKAIL